GGAGHDVLRPLRQRRRDGPGSLGPGGGAVQERGAGAQLHETPRLGGAGEGEGGGGREGVAGGGAGVAAGREGGGRHGRGGWGGAAAAVRRGAGGAPRVAGRVGDGGGQRGRPRRERPGHHLPGPVGPHGGTAQSLTALAELDRRPGLGEADERQRREVCDVIV